MGGNDSSFDKLKGYFDILSTSGKMKMKYQAGLLERQDYLKYLSKSEKVLDKCLKED